MTVNARCDLDYGSQAGTSPRVSVITIFLDAERYLAQAVQSVLDQDFRALELILVDDGSAPVCSAIARDFVARYPHSIRYAEHPGHVTRGMSASRNLGISIARGDLLAFIDADDVWEPTKLREQVLIMDAHPEVAMVCGATRYWNAWNGGEDVIIPTGHVTNAVVRPPEAALALYPLGMAAAPCPSDLLLRRAVVTELGGFEEHFTRMYEDQAFLAKLYLAAPVYISDRVWLSYRQHSESGALPLSDMATTLPVVTAATGSASGLGAPARPLSLPSPGTRRSEPPLASGADARSRTRRAAQGQARPARAVTQLKNLPSRRTLTARDVLRRRRLCRLPIPRCQRGALADLPLAHPLAIPFLVSLATLLLWVPRQGRRCRAAY